MFFSRLAIILVAAIMVLLPYGIDFSVRSAQAQQSRYQHEKDMANASTVTIMSSSVSSTYTRLAQDIQNVLDDKSDGGLRILPILGSGGGQNIHDMLFLKGIDMGITDTAYLQYYKKTDPALYGSIENRINYICKLLNAEFHLLVPKSVRSFADLRGKRVSFWKKLSITSLAAQTIFDALEIEVQPVYLDNTAAIEKLRKGEIAGVARMSGAPHGDYNGVTPADGFRLLPLNRDTLPPGQYAKLLEAYLPAKLTSNHYPQLIPQGQVVETVATNIVLAVYNWPKNSDRYAKVASFVKEFFDNIEKFHSPARHSKWTTVNLAANVTGWQRFPAAQEWLDQNARTSRAAPLASQPSVQAAFEKFLQEYAKRTGVSPQNANERNAMFKSFNDWWQTRQ